MFRVIGLPLPGTLYSWPANEGHRNVSIVLCTLPDTNVNVETGVPLPDHRRHTLTPNATYELHAENAEWSNLTRVFPDFDEAYLDPSV